MRSRHKASPTNLTINLRMTERKILKPGLPPILKHIAGPWRRCRSRRSPHSASRFDQALEKDRQIFVCGNGGSAANASHFVTDLGKGASDAIGRRFRCLSLNDNVPWMTAIGNDYAYADVFRRQLENYARPGDLLMAMSVSGNSPNVIQAVEWAADQRSRHGRTGRRTGRPTG